MTTKRPRQNTGNHPDPLTDGQFGMHNCTTTGSVGAPDVPLGMADPAGDEVELLPRAPSRDDTPQFSDGMRVDLTPISWAERRPGRYVIHITSALIGAGIMLAVVGAILNAMGIHLR